MAAAPAPSPREALAGARTGGGGAPAQASGRLLILIPAVLLCACGGAKGGGDEGGPVGLEPGRPVADRLRPGEVHRYSIRLPSACALRIEVEQKSVDIVAVLEGPGIEPPLTIDSMAPLGRPEVVYAVAPSAGIYRLQVRGFGAGDQGEYALRLDPPAPATEGDRRRAEAEVLLARAQSLRRAAGGALPPRAVEGFQEALAAFEGIRDPDRRAEILLLLGKHFAEDREDHERARRLFQQGLNALSGARRPWYRAPLLERLGSAVYELDDPHGAADLYRRALALWRDLGAPRGEANVLNNLGRAYAQIGDVYAALEAYGDALTLWKELGDPREEALTLGNRASLLLATGRIEEARDDLQTALGLGGGDAREGTTAFLLDLLGRVELRAGRPESALRHLGRGLTLRQPGSPGQGVTLINLGLAHRRLGEDGAALDRYSKARDILDEVGNGDQRATVRHNLGMLWLAGGEVQRARSAFREALGLYRASGSRSGEAASLLGLARCQRRRGDPAAALALALDALDRVESQRASPMSLRVRASYLAEKQPYYEWTVGLLMELHRRAPGAGHAARALEISERGRMRSLLDLLADSGAYPRRGMPEELLEEERRADRRLQAAARRRQQRAAAGASAEELAVLRGKVRDRMRELERVSARIRAGSPLKGPPAAPQPLTLAEIREQVLEAEDLLLAYSLGDEGSYLWAVTQRSLEVYRLPRRGEIAAAARRAHGYLAAGHLRRSRTPAARALEDLGRLLLAPVAEELQDRRLLVVADGPLLYLPFTALTDPRSFEMPGGPAPLIAAQEVVHLPSASVLGFLRRQRTGRPPPPGIVVAVTDPVFHAGDPRLATEAASRRGTSEGASSSPGELRRLRFSEAEARGIVEAAPAEASRLVSGFGANRRQVLGGLLSGYRFVHIATHGRIDSRHPDLSGLELSRLDPSGRPHLQEGFLSLRDIFRLRLDADLVVLSACETALGEEVRGEGLVGLTHAFFHAGARAVVVSLWPVDDRATAALMARFYRHLFEDGLSPAAALRRAQRRIRRQEGWQEPYYWAPFVLEGDWKSPGPSPR